MIDTIKQPPGHIENDSEVIVCPAAPWPLKNALLVNDIKPLTFPKAKNSRKSKKERYSNDKTENQLRGEFGTFCLKNKSIFSTTLDKIIIFMSSLNLRQTSLLDYTKTVEQITKWISHLVFIPPSISLMLQRRLLEFFVVLCCRLL